MRNRNPAPRGQDPASDNSDNESSDAIDDYRIHRASRKTKRVNCPSSNFAGTCASNVPYQCLSGDAIYQCASSPEFWDDSDACNSYCNVFGETSDINRLYRQIKITNGGKGRAWIGIYSETPMRDKTGFSLEPTTSRIIVVPSDWHGLIWNRTGCTYRGSNTEELNCDTGDCGGQLQCTSKPARPVTVASFTLSATKGKPDVYQIDVSRGYNVGLIIKPTSGTYQRLTPDGSGATDCRTASCHSNCKTSNKNLGPFKCYGADYEVIFL